jgi:hypothetical protein
MLVFDDWKRAFWTCFRETGSINSATGLELETYGKMPPNQLSQKFKPVLRIHDMLVWIRIRRSMPVTNGSWSGLGSGFRFRNWPSRCQQKTDFLKSFSDYYFLKVHLHHFSKIKSHPTYTDPDLDPDPQHWYKPIRSRSRRKHHPLKLT